MKMNGRITLNPSQDTRLPWIDCIGIPPGIKNIGIRTIIYNIYTRRYREEKSAQNLYLRNNEQTHVALSPGAIS
jgi:hypothetical protein